MGCSGPEVKIRNENVGGDIINSYLQTHTMEETCSAYVDRYDRF